MQYNVAELLKGPSGARREFEIDEQPQFEMSDAAFLGPLQGRVELMRTQQGILVKADLAVEAEVECARCLNPTEIILEVHMQEEFRPTVDIATGFRTWPEPDEFVDEETLIDEHHILNLDEAVRQELEASMPIKPLCHAACAGICPGCGADLSEGPCQCEPEVDSRWEALRQMLDESTTQ